MRWLLLAIGLYMLSSSVALSREWLDSDADGVPDKKDACGQTQLGHNVEASGCARIVLTNYLCMKTIAGGFYPATCTQLSSNIVKFDFAKSDLLFSQRAVIERIAEWLNSVSVRLLLVGHTDAIGAEAVNQQLSLMRAAKVKQALIDEFNFAPARFAIDGVGIHSPIADNQSRSGRALNRRVEFYVIY